MASTSLGFVSMPTKLGHWPPTAVLIKPPAAVHIF